MLATAILLWADMEDRRKGGTTGERLQALLLPLVATLGRLSTNVYLPLRKTDKSLQLLLRLLQLRHAPGRPATEERQGRCCYGNGRVFFSLNVLHSGDTSHYCKRASFCRELQG